MRVIGCQLDIAWEDKAESCRRAAALIDRAAPPAGSLVVLPEMFATGFSMDVDRVAEGADRTAEKFLIRTAEKHKALTLGGVVRRSEQNGCGRNEAVVFNPHGVEIARYCKIHPFSFAGETEHFESGEGVTLFDWAGLKAAMFVCYDLRFPEVFRMAVRRGAQMLIVIANWPEVRAAHWTTLLTARAIENQAYVVGVNRCGKDPNVNYPGLSLIIDPKGNLLAQAGAGQETVTADIDAQLVVDYRNRFPALRDMRPARKYLAE